MVTWPHSISVEVRSADGSPVEQLLVGLRIRYQLRTYYSTLLGLTDAGGRLWVSGEELSAGYAESQRDFPMDYRLGMQEWDASALVELAGGEGFEQSRTNALTAPLIRGRFREMWRLARNVGIATQVLAIPLDGREATAVFSARRAGPP